MGALWRAKSEKTGEFLSGFEEVEGWCGCGSEGGRSGRQEETKRRREREGLIKWFGFCVCFVVCVVV